MAKEIVILGAGYGGVLSALTVRKYMDRSEAQVTVVNQYPTHQIITEPASSGCRQHFRTGGGAAAG